MKNKDDLCASLESLLSQKLPDEKTKKLSEEGFTVESPTRRTALAIALYKKAESGDLSALKELRLMLESEEKNASAQTVVIIDDIREETD